MKAESVPIQKKHVSKLHNRDRLSQTSGIDEDELISLVCRHFCAGEMSITEIGELLKIGRERPYRLLRLAAERDRLQYLAPLESKLTFWLEHEWPWLNRGRVVHTAVSGDVSYHTAKLLLELILGEQDQSQKREVHLAFAGGGLLRETARVLARMLREESHLGEITLVFHALVAGFNERDPTADPNSFLGHFAGEPRLPATFVNLLAPGVVSATEARSLRSIKAIAEAYDRAHEIDIVVTSAGAHWNQGCSRLHQIYKNEDPLKSLKTLHDEECIGDIIWRPISPKGPVEIETPVRAMTLLELSEIPPLISGGKKVVLALGPCGTCNCPKEEVLQAVLGWKKHHVTHVVVDSLTAGDLYKRVSKR